MTTLSQKTEQANYWQFALWLALFTVFYNIAEGLISIFFGISDEALTLFGFGVDLVHRGHVRAGYSCHDPPHSTES